eukprot:3451114-Rhodomonas_salina.1
MPGTDIVHGSTVLCEICAISDTTRIVMFGVDIVYWCYCPTGALREVRYSHNVYPTSLSLLLPPLRCSLQSFLVSAYKLPMHCPVLT